MGCLKLVIFLYQLPEWMELRACATVLGYNQISGFVFCLYSLPLTRLEAP